MDELLGTLKKYLGNGRWIWLVGGVALILAIAIPANFLWDAVQPKPEPQYQSIPKSGGQTSAAQPEILPAVNKADIEEVAADLNVGDVTTLSMSYQGDTNHLGVTQVVGAGKFKHYTFVKGEDGTWSKQ